MLIIFMFCDQLRSFLSQSFITNNFVSTNIHWKLWKIKAFLCSWGIVRKLRDDYYELFINCCNFSHENFHQNDEILEHRDAIFVQTHV